MECENNYNTYDEDIEVLFSVGRRFLTGNGLEKDVEKGKEMLSQAALMGHSLAQQFLDRYNAENEETVELPKQESDPLTEMLEYNKRFVAEKMYEQYATSKYPDPTPSLRGRVGERPPSSPVWTRVWCSCFQLL